MDDPMQILHPFLGSVQQYDAELSDPERYGQTIARSARLSVR
jgi:hypothetical protein